MECMKQDETAGTGHYIITKIAVCKPFAQTFLANLYPNWNCENLRLALGNAGHWLVPEIFQRLIASGTDQMWGLSARKNPPIFGIAGKDDNPPWACITLWRPSSPNT